MWFCFSLDYIWNEFILQDPVIPPSNVKNIFSISWTQWIICDLKKHNRLIILKRLYRTNPSKMEKRTFDWWQIGVVVWSAFAVTSVASYTDSEGLNRQATFLEGRVGSHVVLNCPLDFPQDDPIPYVLKWFKDVSITIFFFFFIYI